MHDLKKTLGLQQKDTQSTMFLSFWRSTSHIHLIKPHNKKMCGSHPFYLQCSKWAGSGQEVGRKWAGSGQEVGRKWERSGKEVNSK